MDKKVTNSGISNRPGDADDQEDDDVDEVPDGDEQQDGEAPLVAEDSTQ